MQSNAKLNILALLWLVLGLLTMGVMLQTVAAIAHNQVLAAKAAERHKAELHTRVVACMQASPWELRQSCKSLGSVQTVRPTPGFDHTAVQTASLK